jgi:hypothetical protein
VHLLLEALRGVVAAQSSSASGTTVRSWKPWPVRARIFPEAFGMVAAEAAAGGSLPLVARHSGLAEIADALEAAGVTASFETGNAPTWPTSSRRCSCVPPTSARAVPSGAPGR